MEKQTLEKPKIFRIIPDVYQNRNAWKLKISDVTQINLLSTVGKKSGFGSFQF